MSSQRGVFPGNIGFLGNLGVLEILGILGFLGSLGVLGKLRGVAAAIIEASQRLAASRALLSSGCFRLLGVGSLPSAAA